MHCVESDGDLARARWDLCFDKLTGLLSAEIDPLGTNPGERVCFHSDYQKFGEYMVARSYECAEDKQLKIEARVTELAADSAQDPALFVPPEGAKESLNCLGSVMHPEQVYTSEPMPPHGVSGINVVTIGLVVGTDGKPHDVKVTSAPNPGYDEAVLEAVQEWRFKPATCDGEPMEAPISIQTEFRRFPDMAVP
jgi:TonB family protein